MSNRPIPDTAGHVALSRRDLFLGAGMTAGAIAALGSAAGLSYAPSAQAAVASRRYFSTSVGFELEGFFAGPVISAEGGDPVIVPGNPRLGVPPTLRYEPLSMVIGDMTVPVFDWIGKTSTGAATSKSAAIVAYGPDFKETYRLNLKAARLTEIATDSFDAGDSRAMYFHLKVMPESSTHQIGGKSSFSSTTKLKANILLRSNFRLYIQGLESSAPRVRSVEQVGLTLRPDGTLGPLPLKFTVGFQEVAPMVQWMQDTLAGKSSLRQGELQMLSRDLSRVVASVSFTDLTVTRVGCPLESKGEKVQSIEVECEPAALKFNMGELVT